MKRLNSKTIHKALLGIVLSDGYIDSKNNRFDFYSKHSEYAIHVMKILSNITNMDTTMYTKKDKRGYIGYRVFTRKHSYWNNMKSHIYISGRKCLTQYSINRIDELALAHIWMCDGYLEHNKNRKLNKIQNIGHLCFEAFTQQELRNLQIHLSSKYNIVTTMRPIRWGNGFRLRIGGEHLQKFISLIYPHLIDCFKYKSVLYYKNKQNTLLHLPSAEHFIFEYDKVEDIVRNY